MQKLDYLVQRSARTVSGSAAGRYWQSSPSPEAGQPGQSLEKSWDAQWALSIYPLVCDLRIEDLMCGCSDPLILH